jgi:hypothetical protein
MFKLGNIDITTSQGMTIKYELGDDDIYEPKCNIKPLKEDNRGFRQDIYKHLSLNTHMKLRNYLSEYMNKDIFFISHHEIKELFQNVNNDILMYAISMSIYPNIIIDGYILIPHEDGIHIVKVVNNVPLKIALIKNTNDDIKTIIEPDDLKIYKEFSKLKEIPMNNAIISIYSSIDQITFNYIISKILSSKTLSEVDNFLATCLYREGVLIAGKEIPIAGLIDKYIGFINIFNEDFEPLLYNNGNYKSLTPKQLEQLKLNRKEIIIPDMKKEKMQWGLFVPVFTDKEKKNKNNVFKLLTPGEAYGKKTGIVCTSLHKPQHMKIMEDLKMSITGKYTKEGNCNNIANYLYKSNRISLNPSWKPLISNI